MCEYLLIETTLLKTPQWAVAPYFLVPGLTAIFVKGSS